MTGALREWYAEGDEEELEYAALSPRRPGLACGCSTPTRTRPRRRVVVVAEVERGRAGAARRPRGRPGARRRSRCAACRRCTSTTRPPSADVTVAADAVVEADLGSEDAAFRVEQAEGHELQWYATQEIGPLLELS